MPTTDEQIRALQLALAGIWQTGDLKLSELSHPDALTSVLVEAQPGWLIANGATITAAVYPALFALVGATLPDYRDKFIASPGSSNGQRVTGGQLAAAMPAHTHAAGSLAVASHSHGAGTLAVSGSTITGTGELHGATSPANLPSTWATPTVSGSTDAQSPGVTGSTGSASSGGDNRPPFRSVGVVLIHA